MRNLAQMLTITIVITASLLTMFPDFDCVPCLFGGVLILAIMYVYGDATIDAFRKRRQYMKLVRERGGPEHTYFALLCTTLGINRDKWYMRFRFPWESKDR